MLKSDISNGVKIHFVGIGGIGMSALAKFYLDKGYEISGSDLASSEIIDGLKKAGVKIFIGHKKENLLPKTNLAIYSAAVQENNPEVLATKKLGIKTLIYAEALGELTKKYFTIAVSGTHGKSTTTAMLALIMEKAGLDPTVIVGTKLKEWGNENFRSGKSKYLVIEADEYKASFLNYRPKIIVLTNIESEHLDYYKNFKNILKTFGKYIGSLAENGVLIANQDDKGASELLKLLPMTESPIIKKYSLNQKESGIIKKIIKIPGEHNISNALAALETSRVLKIPDKIIFNGLSEFRGVWRRFEYVGKRKGAFIFNDYGHHPTEIAATLKGAREFMKKNKIKGRLWCIFQPHQFERLLSLFKDFINAFDKADKIVILDVYQVAGREEKFSENFRKKIKRKLIAEIKKRKNDAIDIADLKKAAAYLKQNLKKEDLAILMGAGDIYKIAPALIQT